MRPLSLLLLCVLSIYISARSEARDYLLGDWQGNRQELAQSGIEPGLVYTVEYAKPLAGGDDNIEAPTAAKVYEFWYDQAFSPSQSGRTWSLRTGLYDLNSEFDVFESAGGFINSSFGIGPDFAQSGENGSSIFPTTSLALRLRYAADNGV